MKKLAAVYTGKTKKVTCEDVFIGEHIFRKITAPAATGVMTRLKLRRLTRGFDRAEELTVNKHGLAGVCNIEKILDRMSAIEPVFVFGNEDYSNEILPVVLKNRRAAVCVPESIYGRVNSFFLDMAGAACVFTGKGLPHTGDKTVVIMPGAKGSTADAKAVIDLDGSCCGNRVARSCDIRIKATGILSKTGVNNLADFETLSGYFCTDYGEVQVLSVNLSKYDG